MEGGRAKGEVSILWRNHQHNTLQEVELVSTPNLATKLAK